MLQEGLRPHEEDLPPVGLRAVRDERSLDERDDGAHSRHERQEGEVEDDRVVLVALAHPQVVGLGRAHQAVEEEGRDRRAQDRYLGGSLGGMDYEGVV